MKILSRPKGNAEEYGKWAVNPYKGCPNCCDYCYLKSGVWKNGLGGNEPRLKEGIVSQEHAYHVAMAEILENREQIKRDGGLFMTFTSDPCIRETRDLMFRIVSSCIGDCWRPKTPESNIIPVTILTKDATFCPWDLIGTKGTGSKDELDRMTWWMGSFGTYNPLAARTCLAVGWTLTGHDELEPNASPNGDRIKAMKYVSDKGYNVWASIEPVIDFASSKEMICQALAAGCRHFKIGLLTKNTRVVRRHYKLDDCLDFISEVMTLTEGKATVYWKESVRDFIRCWKGEKHPLSQTQIHTIFDIWPHSVGKDFDIFKPQTTNQI